MFLAVCATVFLGILQFTLIIFGIRVSQEIHNKVIRSLLYASISNFFNRIPIGRILNRLSKDLSQVDNEVSY